MCIVSGAIGTISAGVINATIASAVISTATSVALQASAASAQTKQNFKVAEAAEKTRSIEASKINASQRQAAEAATRKKLAVEKARLSSQGSLMAQAAETGGKGNFLTALQRGVNIQAGDRVSAIDAQAALDKERATFLGAESHMRLEGRIGGLPQPPNMGLVIGTGALKGVATGLGTAMQLQPDAFR